MEIISLLITGLGVLGGLAITVCATIIPIIILGGLGYYFYKRNQKSVAQRQDAQNWASTTGTILMSSVQSKRSSSGGYSTHPVIVYQYQVNGQTHQSQTIRVGDKYLRINASWQAQETVNKYPIGKEVTVYYDPNNPADCALER